MESKDYLRGAILKTSVSLAQRTTASAVTPGTAIDVSNVEEIVVFLEATAIDAGTVGLQDIQFANDSSFSVNVTTVTSDDYLRKNNEFSTTSAVAQTLLAAAGTTKLSLANLAINGQKYFRPRAVQSAGSPDATFGIKTLLNYGNKPQIQS